MVFLYVFSHCNEIQNSHLGLWGKAAFPNALTKGKVRLNSRKECLPHARAFLAPISILVEKFPEAYDSWASRLEFRWSEKENYTVRFWGHSASCDAHRSQRVDGPCAMSAPPAGGAEARGDSSLRKAVGRRRERWQGRPASTHSLGFPQVAVRSLGHPVTSTPSL